jgi:hypothetical protein
VMCRPSWREEELGTRIMSCHRSDEEEEHVCGSMFQACWLNRIP